MQVGASVASIYTNPKVEFYGGARIAYRVYQAEVLANNPLAGINLFSEFLWGKNNNFIGGGISIDIGGILQTSVRVSDDNNSGDTYTDLFSVGTNLMYWFNPDCGCNPIAPANDSGITDINDYYVIISVNAKQMLQSLFYEDKNLKEKISDVSRNKLLSYGNIEDVKSYLDTVDLSQVSKQVNTVINRSNNQAGTQGVTIPSPIDQKKLITAFITGWCNAIQQ